MHISEGILSAPVLIGCGAIAAGSVGIGLTKLDEKSMVQTAVVSSALFVATLIRVPIGVSSAHLILNGLAGMLLGWRVFPAFAVAFFLQAMLFGVSGFSTLGVNITMMAIPGFIFGAMFRPLVLRGTQTQAFWAGFAAGSLSILVAGAILAGILVTAGRQYRATATAALLAHVGVMVVEGFVTGAAVAYLKRVRPEVLGEAPQIGGPVMAEQEL